MGWTARQGLTTATGVVVAVLAALLLGLQDPWWSAISAWVVAAPDRHMMLAKAAQRVMGTLLGALTGNLRRILFQQLFFDIVRFPLHQFLCFSHN